MSNFIDSTVADIKKTVGENKVLCAFSGGIDSVVCALLANKAVGGQLVCVMVDHGFMRKNEAEQIKEFYTKNYNLNFILVNAQERFLLKVAGITEPERKRKIIGEEFIRVFEEEAKKLGKIDFLIQGTIKPDIIESGTDGKGLVKSHHNVGGLPEKIGFKLIEPLVSLYKDDVRKYGTELGLPKEIAYRQPFPGVGLAVRCIGELTKEKLDILREADAIFREEIAVYDLSNSVNQYFAVITDMRSVGVRSGERTYEYTVALRAVRTTDFVTASWAKLPYDVLEKVSERITTEVSGINRVLYDVTSKPPATIEWE